MAAEKKLGQKNGEVGLLVEYIFCALIVLCKQNLLLFRSALVPNFPCLTTESSNA